MWIYFFSTNHSKPDKSCVDILRLRKCYNWHKTLTNFLKNYQTKPKIEQQTTQIGVMPIHGNYKTSHFSPPLPTQNFFNEMETKE